MNRRAFLTTLGGAVAALAAKPVLALVPAAPPAVIVAETNSFNSAIALLNAMAYQIHAGTFPEHEVYYRKKALKACADLRADMVRRRAGQ